MNYLPKFLVSFILLASILSTGCSEKEEFTSTTLSMQTVDLCLQVEKSATVATKSGGVTGDYISPGVDEEVPYCGEALATGDYVVSTYSVVFSGSEDLSAYNLTDVSWQWQVGEFGSDDTEGISGLLQLNYPEGATSASFIVTDFRVYSDAGLTDLKFITPKAESAYAGYVSTAVDQSFDIGLYEKQYVKMEVLCFNEETIPLFGFAWSDFEVVTGDEICMFFNCLGTSAMSQHQVLAASVTASFWNGTDWTSYWEGQNYHYVDDDSYELPLSVEPFCIPCPGNWMGSATNTDGGFLLTIYPKDASSSIDVTVTQEQIQAFFDNNEESWTSDDYDVSIALANSTPFVHYTLNDCYKPQAFLVNVNDLFGQSETDVFAVSWPEGSLEAGETDVTLSELFTIDGDWHAAMTPDELKLILVNSAGPSSQWGASLEVYDIYSLQSTTLEFVTPDASVRSAPEEDYSFEQLVYVDGQLYGGCKANECLVPIMVDFNEGTFTYGGDLVDATITDWNRFFNYNIMAGDLLAGMDGLYSFGAGNLGTIIRYSDIDQGEAGTQDYTEIIELLNVTGACMLSNGTAAITSHNEYLLGDKLFTVALKYWKDGVATELDIVNADAIGSTWDGDMASAYNSFTGVDIDAIFGVTEWKHGLWD